MLRIESFYGLDILPHIPALAQLRIKVFHDFPYLYDGNLEYEKKYLEIYTQNNQCVLVAAFDGETLVGAATAMPLRNEADYVTAPFLAANIPLEDIYYFGESVLLNEYRGQGIGHKFFDGREKSASKFGFKTTCFCGVVRAENHPMRPKDYRALDTFWIKRGYKKMENLQSEFSWPDRGERAETKKTMIYWMKTC